MNMSAETLGIIVTFVVLGSVLAVTGALTLDFDLGDTEIILPQINAGTNIDNSKYAYYEWCYAMGKADC